MTKSVDKILKGFSKTISRLNDLTEQRRADANGLINLAIKCEQDADAATAEANHAQAVVAKLSEIINPE